ncbi:P-loop NTPase family protein [Paenibacillus apiarius]|uniref:Thymidylate kinase n=1 Tax=Paenibacillus apiarius TaxID=46240 RepID=A0ABT4DT98_9BACL|nr:hypothetical protein [Paenibacillus apiarius]MCY9515014.1 hypothetical protein [Paenibacillus apiarius]MCY9520564.1 hypothetical protein [Paenibacillus apiarius]MCY9552130.1 hypothetical protein [Paenibacillus apiarius]MCY9561084.1 hypothetical protein [Paenibacillus apiarius]MCY9686275.1 hypothetical protein [Paenibacillus apiarius]
MRKTKLIIVEGVAGSGKTTTARHISDKLREQGIEVDLYVEGNTDHPADYEYTACLTEEQFKELLRLFPHEQDTVLACTVNEDKDYLFCYGRMNAMAGGERSASSKQAAMNAIIQHVRPYDIYDGLPMEKYCELLLLRWERFGARAAAEEKVYIFECCFLQNTLCAMLVRHHAARRNILSFILDLAERVRKLEPVLFYYDQSDIRDTLERAAITRSSSWYEGFLNYHTSQGYGLAHGLTGLEGCLEVLRERKSIEKEVLKLLPWKHFILDNSGCDWEACLERVDRFLENELT